MNNISDKFVIGIILVTILFVFGLIFSVKSPERRVIESPIMWKDDFTNISILNLEIFKISQTCQMLYQRTIQDFLHK